MGAGCPSPVPTKGAGEGTEGLDGGGELTVGEEKGGERGGGGPKKTAVVPSRSRQSRGNEERGLVDEGGRSWQKSQEFCPFGGVAEWFKAAVLKTVKNLPTPALPSPPMTVVSPRQKPPQTR